jgi:hypothetical protein
MLSLASVVVSVKSILSSPVVAPLLLLLLLLLLLSVRSMSMVGSESVKSIIDEADAPVVSLVSHIAHAKVWGSFEYVHAGHARAAMTRSCVRARQEL